MSLKLDAVRATALAAVTLTATVVISPAQAAQLAPGSTLNLVQFNPGAGVNTSNNRLNFFGPGVTVDTNGSLPGGVQTFTLGSNFASRTPAEQALATFVPSTAPFLDGSGAVTIGASTGSFASYTLGAGLIKDLSLPPTAPQSNDFLRFGAGTLQLNPLSFPTVSGTFDLTSFTVVSPTTYNFAGNFAVSGFDLTPGIGQLTLQDLSNPTSYSLSISVPIPTPTLLPGLIGLGVAVIRKRKAERSAVGAEA